MTAKTRPVSSARLPDLAALRRHKRVGAVAAIGACPPARHPVRRQQSGQTEHSNPGMPRGWFASLPFAHPEPPLAEAPRSRRQPSNVGRPRRRGCGIGGMTPGRQPAHRVRLIRGAGRGTPWPRGSRGEATALRPFPAAGGEPVCRVGRHPLGCVRFGPVVARCKPRFACGKAPAVRAAPGRCAPAPLPSSGLSARAWARP
jgi:hypothetical protein